MDKEFQYLAGLDRAELYGWQGRVVLDIDDLNHYWKVARELEIGNDEFVQLETETTPGRTWNFFSGRLAQPAIEYFKKSYNQTDMLVKRSILNETNIRIIREPGREGRYINEINVLVAGDRVLCQEFLLQGARVRFYNGFMRVYQGDMINYIMREGNSEKDTVQAARFRPFLEDDAKAWRVAPLDASNAKKVAEVEGFFYNSDPSHISVFLNKPGWPSGTIPTQRSESQSKASPEAVGLLPNEVALMYYSMLALGKSDMDETAGYAALLAPASVVTSGRDGVVGLDKWVSIFDLAEPFRATREPRSIDRDAVTAVCELNPLLATANRGGAAIELSLSPDNTSANWRMGEGNVGNFKTESGKTWYVPPVALNPVMTFNDGHKTEIKAGLKGALPDEVPPNHVDTVYASVGQGAPELSSSFIVENAPQTHYFKFEQVGTNVKLQLFYRNKSGDEVAVPASNIEWKVMAGNGKVTQEGVFTVDSTAPSLFTTIRAIERDEGHWYWAAVNLPVPLMTVDKAVELLS